MTRRLVIAAVVAVGIAGGRSVVVAHSGPPFPIVTNQRAGAYSISIWTDPDTTDDGSAAGQFWIVLAAADGRTAIPAGTHASVAIRPLDRPGATETGAATPVKGALDRQFVALRMDHEGRFGVGVTVEGPLGRAGVESAVDATYDARPPAGLIAVYLLPFLALGALWAKVLLRRRNLSASPR